MIARVLFVGAALLAPALAAAEADEDRVNWYANIDNDVAFHHDRWYTSGVRIYRSMRQGDAGDRLDIGIVQEIYTNNANCPECEVRDRPYAGRLLLSFARQFARPDSLTTLGADVGVLGPASLARQSQEFFHKFISAPDDDWSHQLHNRFDGQLVAARSQRLLGADTDLFSLVAHGGGVLGTTRAFAHAGAEARVGRGPMSAGLSPSMRFAATSPAPQGSATQGWSGFVGYTVRYVARDRLFTKNDDDPSLPVSRNRTIRRAMIGTSWAASWGAVTFALVEDSREFSEQSVPQRFATLALQLYLP